MLELGGKAWRIVLLANVLPGGCALVDAAEAVDLAVIVVQATRDAHPVSATAGLLPAALFELPLSASVLPVDALAERLPRDIADLADYAAGVSRRSNYWGVATPTFQLRGFNAGDASAYYKDGFRYQGRAPLALANVERVEILREPVSAIYGWSEPGGAVQVVTKQPSARPLRELSVQGDTWGRAQTVLDAGGPLADGVAFRWVAAREQGGSFRERQHLQQTLLAPSLRWSLPDERELSLELEWLDDRRSTDYGIPAVNGAPADVPANRIYTEDWGRQQSRSTRFAARWTQNAGGGLLKAGWSFYRLAYPEYLDAEPYAVSGHTIRLWYESYPEKYHWVTSHVDWSRDFALGGLTHRFASRVEVTRQSRSLYGGELDEYAPIDIFQPSYGQPWTPTAEFSRYDQAWSSRDFGLAVQDEVQVGRWTWLAGLRYSRLQQTFDSADYLPAPEEKHTRQDDSALAPRFGVRWLATPALAFYANASSGQMANLPQNRSFSGTPFVPVRGRQAEVGLKIQPEAGEWQGSLALFDIERRNALTRDPEHPAYSTQSGRQRSRGLELAWQGRLAPGWRLIAQETWLDAHITQDNRYTVGNRLPYAPKFGASVWLSHSFAEPAGGRWRLSGGLVHQGARFADFANGTRLPGYTRFDAGATYQGARWSATLALENATDRRYYASGVENRPAVIYPGAPRTLTLRLSMGW